jgi:hypothetical protein
MSKGQCEENLHVAKCLVLGKDHCGFCYDAVMDFREQLADSLESDIEDIIIHLDQDDRYCNSAIYRAKHKITKLIRGD